MRCSRTPPRACARPRKAEAREGITRYSVDDEDEETNDDNMVLFHNYRTLVKVEVAKNIFEYEDDDEDDSTRKSKGQDREYKSFTTNHKQHTTYYLNKFYRPIMVLPVEFTKQFFHS
jgi:hypothetical protein